MTVDTTTGGNLPANPEDFDMDNIGLEDIGPGDVSIPRLQIIHPEGKFKNSLSGEIYDSGLEVILLGLVKQRIMWDEDVQDNDKPQCKSPDFNNGFPNVKEDAPERLKFPWGQSNFDFNDFPPERGLNGLPTLPCANCIFKDWNKGGWKQPPCSEQHTFPILYSSDGWETSQPALYTVQKTGIKPSRQYISSFAHSRTPMFTVFTRLGLTLQKRGTVTFSVPVFSRGGETDRNQWQEYANQTRAIREFVRQPPRPADDDDEPVASDNENKGPETPTAAAPASAASPAGTPSTASPASPPAAQPAPAASAAATSVPATDGGNDDLPF